MSVPAVKGKSGTNARDSEMKAEASNKRAEALEMKTMAEEGNAEA